MDFTSRVSSTPPQPARAAAPQPGPEMPPHHSDKGLGGHRQSKMDFLSTGSRIGASALLFIITLLVAALVWFIFSASPTPQSNYVNTSKLQAVFLNTGQVYFGNIRAMNKDYLVLNNVYYLQSSSNSTANNSTNQNQNVSLVKLGCELHRPYDSMIVNTAEVTFWENLQSSGQVAQAVDSFQKANPNGQTCSNSSSNSSSSSLQNATSSKP